MSTQLMVIVANYLFIYACGMRHVAWGRRRQEAWGCCQRNFVAWLCAYL